MKKLIALLLFALPLQAQVWVCADGDRVMQTDTSHWTRYDFTANTVWNGTTVSLFGAKNEIVAFQIIIHGTDAGRDSVNVTFDTLAKGSTLIANTPGADSTQYVGRPINLFVEHYFNVTEFNGGETSEGATPDDTVWSGMMADGLVPIEAPRGTYDNGQGGGPFDIAADNVQGVWCDVYIPKTVTSGLYTGNIRIWDKGVITQSIPVELTVKNFTLPDTTHMQNWMWMGWLAFSGVVPQADMDVVETTYVDLFQKYMNLFHRHRIGINTTITYETFSKSGGFGQYVTGSGFTPEKGYDGPGVGVGVNNYSIGIYDCPNAPYRSSFTPDNEAGWQAAADLWEQWFLDNAPSVPRTKYQWDEPFNEGPAFPLYDSIVVYKGDSIRYPFAWIGTRRDWLDAGEGVGKNLQFLLTTAHLDAYDPSKYWPDLEDIGVDWYMTTGPAAEWQGYNVDSNNSGRTAADLRALGNHVGPYNDLRPEHGAMGWWDVPQTEHRSAPWVWWKYECDLWYLWEIAYQWGQGREAPINQTTVEANNPWLNPFGQFASMIYPGTDSLFLPGDSRGWDGPIPSIRMKMLRRGLQDYEYLWLADSAGVDLDSLLGAMVPNGFNDSTGGWNNLTDYPNWEHNDSVFEDARLYLANILADEEPAPQTPVVGVRRRLIRKQVSTE